MDGIILIDKPEGISSFGVVSRVRWLLSQVEGRKVKVGHTGTLDPAASGLMILVIGSYCKQAEKFSKLDKTYEAKLMLGATSTTADREGKITPVSHDQPSQQQVITTLAKLRGKSMQTPPIFSAIKVDGQRAYKLARQGQQPKLEPRTVNISTIDKIAYDYPYLSFTASVSSGTYIRSLAEDIGEQLGCGAYLLGLRRTKIADYKIEHAQSLEKLTPEIVQQALKQGLLKQA